MPEPLLTRREKSTLLKAGIGVGALVWLGPQVIFVLAMALALVVFAGLFLFVAVGAVLKYLAIAAGILLVFGLIFGFKTRRDRRDGRGSPSDVLATLGDLEAEYAARERASRAALDVELAKAVRDAESRNAQR